MPRTATIIPFVPHVQATPGYLAQIVSNASQPVSEAEMRRRIADRRKNLREFLERAGQGGFR